MGPPRVEQGETFRVAHFVRFPGCDSLARHSSAVSNFRGAKVRRGKYDGTTVAHCVRSLVPRFSTNVLVAVAPRELVFEKWDRRESNSGPTDPIRRGYHYPTVPVSRRSVGLCLRVSFWRRLRVVAGG